MIPCTPNCSSIDSACKDNGCGALCVCKSNCVDEKCTGIFDYGQVELAARFSDESVNNSAKDTKYLPPTPIKVVFTNYKMGGDSSVIGTVAYSPPDNVWYI